MYTGMIMQMFYEIPSTPSLMPLPLLYPKVLGHGCPHFKPSSLLSHSLTNIMGFEIKVFHQRIQTTHSHASYCHYCNVDFVLFHNVTCTLVATGVKLWRLEA